MELFALLLAVALVGVNAFFVATEFAIVKVRATRIEELTRKGRPGAASVRHLLSNIDAYLSATQLGVTLASLGLGWAGEPAFAQLIEGPLLRAGVTDPLWIHRIALAGAFGMITFLHIVVGEQAPKSLALLRAESVALAVAYPMRVFYGVFYPIIWVINTVALLILRVLGLSPEHRRGDHHSEEEIKIILTQARSAGLLKPARAELLTKAMSLPTRTARHLMVPRNDVLLLDVNLPWSENLSRAVSAGHTRYPLCDRELDDVIGIVDIRTALSQCQGKPEGIDLRTIATPAAYVPEMMSAERLVAEFRSRRFGMAVVVDEYGGASGIVTPHDIVTAVMGEFGDEESSEVVALPGGAFEVDGAATLEEVAEVLKIAIAADTMRTVAGFLIQRLGRLPRAGDRVAEQGYSFNVVDVAGPRVRTVRIVRDLPSEPGRTHGGPTSAAPAPAAAAAPMTSAPAPGASAASKPSKPGP